MCWHSQYMSYIRTRLKCWICVEQFIIYCISYYLILLSHNDSFFVTFYTSLYSLTREIRDGYETINHPELNSHVPSDEKY